MLKSLRQNSGSILFAVFLSISLWIYVNMKAVTTQIVKYSMVVSAQNGKAIASDYPSTIDIKIRTTGWHFFNLEYIGASRICNVRSESGKATPDGIVYFTKNEILQSLVPNLSLDKVVDVTPEAFSVQLSSLMTKKVPIRPIVQLSFKDNYGLVMPMTIVPDSVELSGSAAALQRINEWKTLPVNLSQIYSNFSLIAQSSDTLKPLVECLTKEIQISGTVDEIVEIEIENIPIIIRNATDKRMEHRIMPLFVSAIVRGGVKNLSRLQVNDIVASVDYSTILNDSTGYIKPIISTPYYIEVISTTPKYLTHRKTILSSTLHSITMP
ncbi:MAG TPA: hypothetical protein PLW09_01720 [Candidatus Kapabacteria bacterium]|jgi:YbbR domain-containing protein|nr:hypothetical protein [Ignavibacteria bacterium]HRE56511.1 hypothetical protein [Candidatus Kapabacteria bacterium]